MRPTAPRAAIHPLTRWMLKRPWLMRWMIPLSRWYGDRMGHRQLGLKYEDLLPEENEATQLALKRLPPKEAYDRVFRIRRAFQVTPDTHCPTKGLYLTPYSFHSNIKFSPRRSGQNSRRYEPFLRHSSPSAGSNAITRTHLTYRH